VLTEKNKVAILDFDGSLARIAIHDFETHRRNWELLLKNEPLQNQVLSPILKQLANLNRYNPDLAKFIYDKLDELECESEVFFLPGAYDLIYRLSDLDIPVLILSNNCSQVINNFLIDHEINNLVNFVQGRLRGANGKPELHTIRALFESIDIKPSDILSLGDRESDLKTVASYSKEVESNYKFWFSATEMLKDIG
jgi:phosphoglycolate phosphatase-like HAD superfamily hydrolase